MWLQLLSCTLLMSLRLNLAKGWIQNSEIILSRGWDSRDDKSRSKSSEVKSSGSRYIKKGTPKVFRHCEIVENIIRLRVRVTKSLWNITKSQCRHY